MEIKEIVYQAVAYLGIGRVFLFLNALRCVNDAADKMEKEAVKWGEKGARVNSISPGIIVTPLAIDEFNGPRGDFYKNMFAKCPAGRPGTADEVANVAELLMSDKGHLLQEQIS